MNTDTLIACVAAAVAGYAAMSFLVRADFSCFAKGKAPKQPYHEAPSYVPDEKLAERWLYEIARKDEAISSAWKKTIRVSSLTDDQIDEYTRQGHLPPRWDGSAGTIRPSGLFLSADHTQPGNHQRPRDPTLDDIVGRRSDGTWIFRWDHDA